MADLVPGRRSLRTAPESATWLERAGNGFTLVSAGLAASPDIDLLFQSHRTVTHSAGAVIVVALISAAVAANAQRPIGRVAAMCAAAYGTHLLLDWLCADNYPPRGLQVLWPFTSEWYIAGWEVFRRTSRNDLLTPAVIRRTCWRSRRSWRFCAGARGAVANTCKALAGLATELAAATMRRNKGHGRYLDRDALVQDIQDREATSRR